MTQAEVVKWKGKLSGAANLQLLGSAAVVSKQNLLQTTSVSTHLFYQQSNCSCGWCLPNVKRNNFWFKYTNTDGKPSWTWGSLILRSVLVDTTNTDPSLTKQVADVCHARVLGCVCVLFISSHTHKHTHSLHSLVFIKTILAMFLYLLKM